MLPALRRPAGALPQGEVSPMTLGELWKALLKKKAVKPSRVAPVACSLKHYAAALGYNGLESCPESAYNIPPRERNRLIGEKARRLPKEGRGAKKLTARTVSNIKSDVTLALNQGAALGLIRARSGPPGRKATEGLPIHKYKSHTQWRRGLTTALPKIAIPERELPTRLREGLDEYYRWATDEFVDDRPKTRKRRAISADYDRGILRRVAGFHVKHCGARPSELTLETLTRKDVASKYINWFITHHGRTTETLRQVLISIESLAKYLTIIARTPKKRAERADAALQIKDLLGKLPEAVEVRDKKQYWLTLEEIETCGINRYPRNEVRLAKASAPVRQMLQTFGKHGGNWNLKTTAVYAMESLFIRLIVRLPLRARNFCEMSWNPYSPGEGKNLFRKDGRWYVRFKGEELKVDFRRKKVHSILHRVPRALNWLIEEVLTVWRPIITGVPYRLPDADEAVQGSYVEPPQTKAPAYKKAPKNVLLFLTSDCTPTNRHILRFWLESTTYGYAGVAVYPHLVRDIWATTYIKRTRDIAGAAMRLGNTYETTLKHYAHLLDEDAEEGANAFNGQIFGEGEED